MKYRIIALAVSLIVAGGIVIQATGSQESSPQETSGNNSQIPEMSEKYTTVQTPMNNTEVSSSLVPIRFDLRKEMTRYQLFIDDEVRKTGTANETNIVYVEVEEGEHTYRLELFNGTDNPVDRTRTRTFSFTPATNITLVSPAKSVESGQEVEFTYRVETDEETNVELFIDDEKAAEDLLTSDQEITTTVRNIDQGNHTWTVETEYSSRTKHFQVEESLPALQINSFSVQNSDDGWNARVDVEAQIETSYELLLNGEVQTTGTVEQGSSSLGLPITPESGQNTVKITFSNEEGSFETGEETINAN